MNHLLAVAVDLHSVALLPVGTSADAAGSSAEGQWTLVSATVGRF